MTETTNTNAYFVVVENGIYDLCALRGVDVHAFTTETAMANFIAGSPETRRVTEVGELANLPVRHWELHEDTLSNREVAAMAYPCGSVTVVTYEPGEAECLAFGW